jgi:opacity protein-like surface antigen
MYFNTLKTIGIHLAYASALASLSLSVQAQQSAKPVAKKSAPAKKAPARTAPAAAAAAAIALSSEQLGIAQIVTTGRISCADGKSVTITPDARTQGAFDLGYAGARYDVIPQPTSSGAIRLENKKTGIVYMQLANKSMLFNEKQSRRLADDCISPAQQAVADQMKANPTPSVLDAPAK